MKYLVKIALGLFVYMAAVASCKDDDDSGITGFSIDKEDITMGADGGKDIVTVSSGGEWAVSASEPWVNISPANGFGATECTVSIDSTLINGMRKAEIRFIPQGQAPCVMTVHQTGYGKMIYIEKPDVEIKASDTYDNRHFDVIVTTNVAFKMNTEYDVIPEKEWLTLPEDPTVDLDRGSRPRTTKIRVEWTMNPDFDIRTAKIHFTPKSTEDKLEQPAVLTISQKASPRIEDNRSGDSLTLLTIRERLEIGNNWNPGENMRYWDNVVLWEEGDEGLPKGENVVGRVRSVSFNMINTKESVPQEVHYLTYVESLTFFGNSNTATKSITLEDDVCGLEYLKSLTVSAYGLSAISDNLVLLGDRLETLDLSSNNFNSVPSIITKENFPKLKSLNLIGNRRSVISDLRNAKDPVKYPDGIGLFFNTKDDNTLRRLFMWDNLEELRLSYNFIEGTLPDFEIGVDGVTGYSQADVEAFGGDTIQYLVNEGAHIPKILPKMRKLSVNLNFFTGNLPEWVLYHPHLIEWDPEVLIYNQMEKGLNSEGKMVRFDNEPTNFDKYFEAFHKFKEKYELKD